MSHNDEQSDNQPAGVYTAACASGVAFSMPGACPWCSSGMSATFHNGPCPRLKAIEYHPNGMIRRVEFHRWE